MISIRYKSATFFGLILAMTALFMLPSCSGSNDGTGNIPTIDFTDTSAVGDESILKVDAFCVPALTDSTMLNYPEPCGMSGNKIYLNSNDGTLVVFDITSGRCLSSFSTRGRDRKIMSRHGMRGTPLAGAMDGLWPMSAHTRF